MKFFTKKVKSAMIGALYFSSANSYASNRTSLYFETNAEGSLSTNATQDITYVTISETRGKENDTSDTTPASSTGTSKKETNEDNKSKVLPEVSQGWLGVRRKNAVYVDKTIFLLELRDARERLYVFTRPRRFGKTFFVCTMESYFRGEETYFTGTNIHPHGNCKNKTWIKYPVFRLNLDELNLPSNDTQNVTQLLDGQLYLLLKRISLEYNLQLASNEIDMANIIELLYLKFNLPVVVLVDEYDKLINKAIYKYKNEDLTERLNYYFNEFLAQIKSVTACIKVAWVTGVNILAIDDMSSGPNSFTDVTFDAKYSTLVGFTEQEILDNFKHHINHFSTSLQDNFNGTVDLLREWYDGYYFDVKEWNSIQERKVYNPISVINCLKNQQFSSYWSETGNIKHIVKTIYDFHFHWDEDVKISKNELLKKYPHDALPIWLLLLRNGYLTFNEYNMNGEMYTLKIPTKEVKRYLSGKLEMYIPKLNMFIDQASKYLVNLNEKIRRPETFSEAVETLNELGFRDFEQPLNDIDNGEFELTRQMCLFFHHSGIGYDQHILNEKTKRNKNKTKGDIDVLTTNLNVNHIIEIMYGHPQNAVTQILGYFMNDYNLLHAAVKNQTNFYLTAISFKKIKGISPKIEHWIVMPCRGKLLLVDEIVASTDQMKKHVEDYLKTNPKTFEGRYAYTDQ